MGYYKISHYSTSGSFILFKTLVLNNTRKQNLKACEYMAGSVCLFIKTYDNINGLFTMEG